MNNFRKLSVLSIAALGVVAGASAQSTPVERPWKVEVGVYQPTLTTSGLDEKTGLTFALGYTFTRLNNGIEIEGELRGTTYRISSIGGRDTVNLGQLAVNGIYRQATSPLFFGAGLGLAQGEIKIGGVTFTDNKSYFVYQLIAGYTINERVYATVRYHGSGEEAFKGFSLGVGYRF